MTPELKRKVIPIAGAVILIAALWLAWPSSVENPAQIPPAVGSGLPASRTMPKLALEDDEPVTGGFRSSRRGSSTARARTQDGELSRQDEEALRRIDHLLINESIDHSEAARRLKTIATSADLSNSVRSEALAHGLLLDVEHFSTMAGDPSLPADMAMEVLNEVINYNDRASIQIQVYRDFLDHPSVEVRELATDMLRFMVEDDFEEMDRPALLRAAEQKWNEAVREEAAAAE